MNLYEKDFARFYDILVYNKEKVEAKKEELQFIEWAFHHCPREVTRVLDVGCGNGRLLLPLARGGYSLTGIDISAEMLSECKRRLEADKVQADLIQKDIATMEFEGAFDALLCMDSVICYFLEAEQIVSVLKRFRRALRPQGVLILENWNILAHWDLFGVDRSCNYADNEVMIEWQESTRYETFTSILHGIIAGTISEKGNSRQFRQEEILRTMTAGEMLTYLREAGFTNRLAYPSYDLSQAANVNGDILLFVALSP